MKKFFSTGTLTIEVELEEEELFDVDSFNDPELALSSLTWHISLGDS